MRKMPIVWKRLVKNGETCTRCDATGRELKAAVTKLQSALRPLGIEPVLEEQAIHEDTFKGNPSESNRAWIAGKPVEDWLGAGVEMSHCGSVCGDSDCRTLKVDGRTYETIPEQLFIKAGLMADGQMEPGASSSKSTATSCSSTSGATPCVPKSKQAKSGCCTK